MKRKWEMKQLRVRALELVAQGLTMGQIEKRLNLDRKTLNNWGIRKERNKT